MTLNLVKGATFHDGEPITSEDVKFSINTIKANHPFKTMFAAVKDYRDTGQAHSRDQTFQAASGFAVGIVFTVRCNNS